MRIDLDVLLGLPRSGVIAILDQGVAQVFYSTSMGASLETLYNAKKGREGLVLEIWSQGADIETLRLHAEFFKAHYGRLGYSVVPSKKCIQYRCRVIPGKDFKTSDVELVTARGESKIVGRFRTNLEAHAFIETFYCHGNDHLFPIYAWNSATKEFMLEPQKKRLEIK